MISDKMNRTLTAIRDKPSPDGVQFLSDRDGLPYKVAFRRVEKAVDKGYAGYGVSVRTAWIEPMGLEAINTRDS